MRRSALLFQALLWAACPGGGGVAPDVPGTQLRLRTACGGGGLAREPEQSVKAFCLKERLGVGTCEELLAHMRGMCDAQSSSGTPDDHVEAAFTVDRRVKIPITFADGTEADLQLGPLEDAGAVAAEVCEGYALKAADCTALTSAVAQESEKSCWGRGRCDELPPDARRYYLPPALARAPQAVVGAAAVSQAIAKLLFEVPKEGAIYHVDSLRLGMRIDVSDVKSFNRQHGDRVGVCFVLEGPAPRGRWCAGLWASVLQLDKLVPGSYTLHARMHASADGEGAAGGEFRAGVAVGPKTAVRFTLTPPPGAADLIRARGALGWRTRVGALGGALGLVPPPAPLAVFGRCKLEPPPRVTPWQRSLPVRRRVRSQLPIRCPRTSARGHPTRRARAAL